MLSRLLDNPNRPVWLRSLWVKWHFRGHRPYSEFIDGDSGQKIHIGYLKTFGIR